MKRISGSNLLSVKLSAFLPFALCNVQGPLNSWLTMASVEDDLICSVCRDLFSQSHPLPCGHSFCPSCIREAWGQCKRFICPQCQEEPSEVLCDCCPPEAERGSASLAVKTCLRCEVSLCAEHLQPHLERPAFSRHLLVDPVSDLSQRRCPTHAEIFRYYCADERIYVCGDCLLDGGHAEHQVKALRQVEEDLKVMTGLNISISRSQILPSISSICIECLTHFKNN